MLRRPTRSLAAAVAGLLPLLALTAVFVEPPAAQAYNVCSDPGEPCTHEKMARYGVGLLSSSAEAGDYLADIERGAGHEDEFDHVYGIPFHEILDAAIITMTHFWDADPGDFTPSTYGEFEEPFDLVDTSLIVTENAFQKARHFWSLAVGAYANGDKHKAYEYLGHIAHFIGDMSVPTHAHGDAHVDAFNDEDPYEEWMSDPNLFKMEVIGDEYNELKAIDNTQPGTGRLGPLNGDVPPGVDPLYYMLYTTNQLADFFASRDVDGDTFDRHGWVQPELDEMAATISTPRVQDHLDDNDNDPFEDINDNDGDLSRIREITYKWGIRAIAGLFRHFDNTVAAPMLAVRIDYLKDVDDDADRINDADFYGKVTVNNWLGQNRGEEALNREEVIDPQWAYGAAVPATGSVPVHIEVFDEDGESPLVFTAQGEDDLIDIDGQDDADDSTLDLSVDLAKCLRGEAGAISGDLIGACGQQLESQGDNDPPILDSERAKIRFTVFVPNLPPVADAGDDVQTPEGTDVELDGTGSTDPEGKPLQYAWDLDGGGVCDDAVGDPTPMFTRVGNDGTHSVKLCVTDAGGLTDQDTVQVTVTNVAPAVDAAAPAPVAENTSVTVSGTIRDPGWLDPLSATIDWGDGNAVPLAGNVENVRPDATLTFSASHVYGDNGTFQARVCAEDDDTTACRDIPVAVTNVDPTADIDITGQDTVDVNGVPTVIAHVGAGADFAARITDPGSDDLTVTWDWGDGSGPDTTTSLVNPPDPDPPLSPSIQPRDINAAGEHAFAKACVYTSALAVHDDDGGTASGSINVVVVGNGTTNLGPGYWKQQVRRHAFGTGPKSDFDADTLACYLQIVDYMSLVFDEETPSATFAEAWEVFDTRQTSAMTALFDQQLLAVWMNFANGAVEWDELVDTNGDRVADTPFLTAVVDAEAVRQDPTTTRAQLGALKRVVEGWTVLP